MWIQIALGALLLAITTAVHALATGLTLAVLKQLHVEAWRLESLVIRVGLVAGLAVALFATALVEAALWAVAYLQVGAIGTFEEALYFSTVTFSTLGYGDLTLTPEWRLLSSFQAANGTILFGWSTALLFAFVQRVSESLRTGHSAGRH